MNDFGRKSTSTTSILHQVIVNTLEKTIQPLSTSKLRIHRTKLFESTLDLWCVVAVDEIVFGHGDVLSFGFMDLSECVEDVLESTGGDASTCQ